MMDQPNSQLAGLSLDQTIHLRWTLRDIKSKRTKFSPVSPDDLRTLIEWALSKCVTKPQCSQAKATARSIETITPKSSAGL
jgi:hypothetical protein